MVKEVYLIEYLSKKQAARWEGENMRRGMVRILVVLLGDIRLLTTSGYRTFEELAQLDNVNLINKLGNISLGKVWVSGKRNSRSRFSRSKDNLQVYIVPPDHVFLTTNNEEVQAKKI